MELTAKQMIVLAARTANSTTHGVGYKAATPRLNGDGGSYQVFYGLVTA